MRLINLKDGVVWIGGGILGVLTTLFGGFDMAFKILIVFMVIDYLTGFMTAIYCNSSKSESGGLSSNAGFKGIVKKVFILMLVIVANLMDLMLGFDYIRSAVVVAFTINETVSILENVGLMGIPIPQVLLKTIEVLKKEEEAS